MHFWGQAPKIIPFLTNLIYYFSLLFTNNNTLCLGMLAFLSTHQVFIPSLDKQLLLLEHGLIGNEICQELASAHITIQARVSGYVIMNQMKSFAFLLCLMHVNKWEVNCLTK